MSSLHDRRDAADHTFYNKSQQHKELKMAKRFFVTAMLLAWSLFIADEVFSAWTQPKGHSYNQLTISNYHTTQKFTTIDTAKGPSGLDEPVSRVDTEEFQSTKITYYGEYGITDKITIFTGLGWDWQKSNDNIRYGVEQGPSGIGDINLGLRHSLLNNILGTGVLMSIQAEVKIPEAYEYESPVTHLSLGDGQYDSTIKLLFGRGFSKGYAWVNTGYKFRFENDQLDPLNFTPSDQIKISFGGGYAVTSWLSIRGLVDWTKSVGNAEVSPEMETAFLSGGGLSWHQDIVIIKDSLVLEPNVLSAGIDLAFNIAPKWQTVLSYNTDLPGFGEFKTEDAALGETFSLAIVYMH